MIILRVAMGRGLLKETVKEIDTMLVFAKPDTVTVVDSEKGTDDGSRNRGLLMWSWNACGQLWYISQ